MMVSFCSGVARANTRAVLSVRSGAAVDDGFAGADNVQAGGDGAGRGRVVAGDEHRGDAGRLAGADGRCRGRPGRVEDGDQAEQPQPAFHLLLVAVPQHPGFGGGQVRQRRDGLARLDLLDDPTVVFTTITSTITSASARSPVARVSTTAASSTRISGSRS